MANSQNGPTVVAASGVLHFEDPAHWRYDSGHMAVLLHVFAARNEVRCMVSEEFIEDTYGDAKDVLVLAQEHADAITDRVGDMIVRGQFEPDGSVLLRSVPRGLIG